MKEKFSWKNENDVFLFSTTGKLTQFNKNAIYGSIRHLAEKYLSKFAKTVFYSNFQHQHLRIILTVKIFSKFRTRLDENIPREKRGPQIIRLCGEFSKKINFGGKIF